MGYAPTVSNVATGLYKVQIDATAGNGFEAGKRYSVYVAATVGGIAGRDGIGEFEVLATDLNTALDTNIGSRLATAGYTAPDNATIAIIQADTNDIQTRIPAALVSGRMDASVGAMQTDVLTAAALAADAVAEIQSGLATLAGQAAIVGYIDTEVADILTACAAIKAKTDSLTFTVAGKVDANMTHENSTQIKGDGTIADKFRSVLIP
jgi:hypothetical protein